MRTWFRKPGTGWPLQKSFPVIQKSPGNEDSFLPEYLRSGHRRAILLAALVVLFGPGCVPPQPMSRSSRAYLLLLLSPEENSIDMDPEVYESSSNLIIIKENGDRVITGTLRYQTEDHYSFAIFGDGEPVFSGDLKADDGVFDSKEEAFSIQIDDSVKAGYYSLRFYKGVALELDFSVANSFERFSLEIQPANEERTFKE